jgi:Protein of unknown function
MQLLNSANRQPVRLPLKGSMTDIAAEPTPEVPSCLTPEDLATDALILAAATAQWCKIALVIARTVDLGRAEGRELTSTTIAPRIYAMAESGALSVQGNVRRWRAGEVKLPTAPPAL